MSNIIKSFRVIEGNALVTQKEIEIKPDNFEKEILEKARKKYRDIISKANEEAEKIIDKAYKEYDEKINAAYEKAKSIYEENKEKGYNTGFNLGREDGFNDGYKDGYLEGKNEAQKIIEEALAIKKDYIYRKNKLLRESEEELINLVISIYEKVLHKKVEEDQDLIVSLVLSGIENLEIKDKLTIIVSEDSYDTVNKYKDIILAKAPLIDEIDIRVNSDMVKGDCILETSKGNIDVSVDNQLEEIKDLIMSILNNE